MTPSPIILFVYNRLSHTQRTVDALKKNNLAHQSDLIVYSDAAKTPVAIPLVQAVRDYVQTISGFKSVSIIERPHNFGLADSIISGVTDVINTYQMAIVLEDDLVTSPFFLTYMNEALVKYANDDRVISVHGYVYPVETDLPEAFFMPGADCWGWATWRRGWACFNPDGQLLLDELKRRKLVNAFDFNGSYPFTRMLKGQINNKNNSWAIRWYASAFLSNMLTLYPGRSLVYNIGHDNSGTHCMDTTRWESELSDGPINLDYIVVEPSQIGLRAFEDNFRQSRAGISRRVKGRIASVLRMLFGAFA